MANFSNIRTHPLRARENLVYSGGFKSVSDDVPSLTETQLKSVKLCAEKILTAKEKKKPRVLMFGGHLVKNGGVNFIKYFNLSRKFTHYATAGASTIHDTELAFMAQTSESVKKHLPEGKFGTWDETSRFIHLALYSGLVSGMGYGEALGRLITSQYAILPECNQLRDILIDGNPELFGICGELLSAYRKEILKPGKQSVDFIHRSLSIFSNCFCHDIPITVHPGIGYDIIACNPNFNGAIIGKASEIDFKKLVETFINLNDGGVIVSIGSAVMAPQVYEKALSCANNLRIGDGKEPIHNYDIFVVDLQDGGDWDWNKGEPSKDNPAYYLRFMKSFSRGNGNLHYIQCDNIAFLHNLYKYL